MKGIFKTFEPKNSTVRRYVDYYYLDIKNNITNEFQCFPHFNSTISLYKSHTQLEAKLKDKEILFNGAVKPFQIFTPIRENIVTVKQKGKVYRIVIVFHPFGIQQFYRNINFSRFITDFEFFTQNELQKIFSTKKIDILTNLMDGFLMNRFIKFDNPIIEKTIHYIFNNYDNFLVAELSNKIETSRQHLNRVFKSQLGVSVKKFHEIVVFRQTINKRLFESPDQNFTEIAHNFNFSDQSHLIKAYKKLTEYSPKTFFLKGSLLGSKDTFWHLEP